VPVSENLAKEEPIPVSDHAKEEPAEHAV
jgi:hypothetical protein